MSADTSVIANAEKLQELDRNLFKCLSLRAESVNNFYFISLFLLIYKCMFGDSDKNFLKPVIISLLFSHYLLLNLDIIIL